MDDFIFYSEYPDSVPPLTKAVRAGDLKKIRKLLHEGCLPQAPDNRGWTAIHCCAAENQIRALKLLLKSQAESKKYLVNLTTWESVTPLHLALKATKPSLQMVKILLEAGADPNLCTHTKLSPLHLACMKKGNYHIVKLLVEYGGNVNIQEDLGLCTPLLLAICSNCDLETIKYLVNLSDLSLANINERTAFLEACNLGNFKVVEVLLEKDKSLANTLHGLSPLAYAGFAGNLDLIQLLLNSGADVNLRCKAIVPDSDSEFVILDSKDFLPIHSSLSNIEVFKLLLKLTNTENLLKVDFFNFPIFVMIFGNEAFYKTLLQSDVPDALRTIPSHVLVRIVVHYVDGEDIVIEKLPMIFKYNFSLEPENVLKDLMKETQKIKFCTYCKFVHFLAQVGIPNKFQSMLLGTFQNLNCKHAKCADLVRSICHLISESVLSLKHYCRIALRRHIKGLVGSDWLCLKMVEELKLPDCLKNFVLFEN